MLKRQISPGATILALLAAVAIGAGVFYYAWNFGGKDIPMQHSGGGSSGTSAPALGVQRFVRPAGTRGVPTGGTPKAKPASGEKTGP